jgi:hypothetical protein
MVRTVERTVLPALAITLAALSSVAACDVPVHGAAQPALRGTEVPLPTPVEPNWPTLINPAAGLSYQIPPTDWTSEPAVGSAGSVMLTTGATRSPYTCGSPPALYLRGSMGGGTAPKVDPSALATSVAMAAAQAQYVSGKIAPDVTVGKPTNVSRKTHDATVSGALVKVVVTTHGDQCLATAGEIYVLVLALADHDAVLMVGGDVGGGPADPKPPTDAELTSIIDTAQPI